MKSQRAMHWSRGYTIVELMIFMAASGGLLVAAMQMISNQQERTRFTTTVREVESKLADIFNDVETGVYPSNGSIGCRVINGSIDPSARPSLTGPAQPQGANQECLFMGKAIEFYRLPGDTASNYRAFTIVGRRQTVDKKEVASIFDAKPTAFDQITEEGSFASGVELTQIRYGATAREGIVVLSPIGPFSALEPALAASNGKPRLATINFTNGFADNSVGFRNAVSSLDQTNVDAAANGAVICLRHSAGGRVAAIAIGVQSTPAGAVPFGQRLATQAYFDDEATVLGCTS